MILNSNPWIQNHTLWFWIQILEFKIILCDFEFNSMNSKSYYVVLNSNHWIQNHTLWFWIQITKFNIIGYCFKNLPVEASLHRFKNLPVEASLHRLNCMPVEADMIVKQNLSLYWLSQKRILFSQCSLQGVDVMTSQPFVIGSNALLLHLLGQGVQWLM